MINRDLIIGITGTFGSGKSTAADFFKSKGFKKIILSSFLEKEANRRGFGKITRKILQDIGNEWRKKYGKEILAKKALKFLGENKLPQSSLRGIPQADEFVSRLYLRNKLRSITARNRVVIDGIRNVGEIDEFGKNSNFVLIAILTDRKVRFTRLKKIKRREHLTWELFNKLDRRDIGVGQGKVGLQVGTCLAMADIFIDNNSGMDEFKNKLTNFLKHYV